MYTAIPETSVDTSITGNKLRVTIPDLNSQMSQALARNLQTPLNYVVIGEPKTLAELNLVWAAMKSRLVGTYPDIANGMDADTLVAKYAAREATEISDTPLDPSGRFQAGMIADHLGAIALVNGQLDMSGFAPTPQPKPAVVDDPADFATHPKPPGAGEWHILYTLVGLRWAEGPSQWPGIPSYELSTDGTLSLKF